MAEADAQALHLVCGNRNYSSWSLRAWLCLAKAGLNPRVTVLPMDTPEYQARIGELSPTRRVPVLWIDGEAVWDSLAIAETVNERFAAGRLWPTDPSRRSLARAMAAEMHSGFSALRDALPMNCRARGRQIAADSAVRADIDRLAHMWGSAWQRGGRSGGWLFGEFSIADAMFAPVAVRFQAYELDLPDTARRYAQHWLQDEMLQQWIELAATEPWVIDHEEAGTTEVTDA